MTSQIFAGFPPGSGGGSTDDMFSTLVNSPVAVTTTATAQVGKLHYVTGTTVDYTITFPPVSGNDKKVMGFIFGPTITELSRFVTVDGDGSETIGGTTSKLLWAGEALLTICNEANSNWSVLIYNGRPMSCRLLMSGTTGVNHGIQTSAVLNTIVVDNTARMADTANDRIIVRRQSNYLLNAAANFWPFNAASVLNEVIITDNGSTTDFVGSGNGVGEFWNSDVTSGPKLLTANNAFKLEVRQFTGTTQTLNTAGVAYLSIVEQPSWLV